jgi:type VI secretion system protein ImpI
MALRLTIENVPNLPDGGPTSFVVTGKRSVDIGRDQHLDWTLPDPSRFISGKHCEVHYRNNAYWLHDVSTNGTFLNGSDQRMRSPHELKNGDRLVIGQYIVGVSLDGDSRLTSPAAAGQGSPQPVSYPELWGGDADAPPPIDRQQIRMARETARPVNPDFLDWAAGVPEVEAERRPRSFARRPSESAEMDWASGPPIAARTAPEPAAPVVAPRRPVWKDDEPAKSDVSPFLAPSPVAAEPAVERPIAAPQPPVAIDGAPTESPRGANDAFVRRMAQAAGLPADFFNGKDADQLADQFGDMMRITVTGLMQLLQSRNEAKRLVRSTSQTSIQATENNPLKFSPTAEDAIRVLFGPNTRSYLDAHRAFAQGFDDLKSHQLKTYMAMQHAVTRLVAGIDPALITKELEAHENIFDSMRSRKSRLWEAFLARWKAGLGRDSGAAIEAFMLHFSDYYDQDGKGDSR